MEHREALIPALTRIALRYGVGGILGMTFSDDPDVILVVTILVGLAVEGWYARDYMKRGPSQ
jgi:hypothetical protein